MTTEVTLHYAHLHTAASPEAPPPRQAGLLYAATGHLELGFVPAALPVAGRSQRGRAA